MRSISNEVWLGLQDASCPELADQLLHVLDLDTSLAGRGLLHGQDLETRLNVDSEILRGVLGNGHLARLHNILELGKTRGVEAEIS